MEQFYGDFGPLSQSPIPLEMSINDPYGYPIDDKLSFMSLGSFETKSEPGVDYPHSSNQSTGGDGLFLANYYTNSYNGDNYPPTYLTNSYQPPFIYSSSTNGHGCGSSLLPSNTTPYTSFSDSGLLFAAENPRGMTIKDGEYLVNIMEKENDNIIFVSNDIETREEVVGDGTDQRGMDCFSLVHEVKQIPTYFEPSNDNINCNGLIMDEFADSLYNRKPQMDGHRHTDDGLQQTPPNLNQPKSSTGQIHGKTRRKKKDSVEYVLLDANSSVDDKKEFIKYVGKGSYKCQICDIYSKNNKDYIQDHINIKHYNIKKNYECLLCKITFAWRSGAFKHLKKYHSIEGKNTINYFRAISKRHIYHSQRRRKGI